MTAFSVQNPEARYFLKEWVYHKLLEQENVLTTQYRFAPLFLNGKNLGLYAVEEHFRPSIPKRYGRPEGILLRFSEDGIWSKARLENEIGKKLLTPQMESAVIRPFSETDVLEHPEKRKAFLEGRDQLDQFRFDVKPISALFEVEAAARFYALTELCGSRHGMHWHNQRFYWNASDKKLEFVGYDAFTEKEEKHPPLLLKSKGGQAVTRSGRFRQFITQAFNDPVFRAAYFRALEEYTHPDFISAFWEKHKEEAAHLEIMIQKEYPEYHYDWEELQQRAATYAELIRPKKLEFSQIGFPSFVFKAEKIGELADSVVIPKLSLVGFVQQQSQGKQLVRLYNNHPQDLKVIGFGDEEHVVREYLDQPLILKGMENSALRPYLEYKVSFEAQSVYFQAPGSGSVYREELVPWAAPMKEQSAASGKWVKRG